MKEQKKITMGTHVDPQFTGYFDISVRSKTKRNLSCYDKVPQTLLSLRLDYMNNKMELRFLVSVDRFPLIDFIEDAKKNGIKSLNFYPTKPTMERVDYFYVGKNGKVVGAECSSFDIEYCDKTIYTLVIKFKKLTIKP